MIIDIITDLSHKIEAELQLRYKEYNLTINQVDLLLHFYTSVSNEINATETLNVTNQDKRLLSLMLKSLETKAYINRYDNVDDKRQKNIELSMKALGICDDLIEIKNEVNELFMLEYYPNK